MILCGRTGVKVGINDLANRDHRIRKGLSQDYENMRSNFYSADLGMIVSK